MTIRISVDVGSGYTKFASTASDSPRYAFPSVVAEVLDKNRIGGLGAGNPSIIEFGGTSYIVGEDAQLLVSTGQRRSTLSDDYALSDQWLALFYSALAQAVPVDEKSVQVCVALPQAVYQGGSVTDALLDRLNNDETSFTYKGVHRKFAVSAIVAPQAGAVILDCASRGFGNDPDVETGVIDIGTYTTGLAVMLNDRLYHERCSGISEGVAKIAATLSERLKRNYGMEFNMPYDLPALHALLQKGSVKHLGESKDIALEIADSSTEVARKIIDEVRRKWPRPNAMEIYIAGGGAPFLDAFIRAEYPHAVAVSDPFWSVLNGLSIYANETF